MKILSEKLYPEYFPDGCPPKDAYEPQNKILFRLVSHSQKDIEDFKTYYELGRAVNSDSILKYGLSMIENIDSARSYVKRNPKLKKRYHYIAQATLTSKSGKIKLTPSDNIKDHYTWWIYNDVDPLDFVDEIVRM